MARHYIPFMETRLPWSRSVDRIRNNEPRELAIGTFNLLVALFLVALNDIPPILFEIGWLFPTLSWIRRSMMLTHNVRHFIFLSFVHLYLLRVHRSGRRVWWLIVDRVGKACRDLLISNISSLQDATIIFRWLNVGNWRINRLHRHL